MVSYYIDPDWAGVKSGTEAQPWATISWSTINTALASNTVTVYFSARDDDGDTAEDYGQGINIYSKTEDPGYTLILDGKSKYNTDDVTPSWAAYSGANKCIVKSFISQNSGQKYNDVQIRGFTVVQTVNTKAISIAGDDWLIASCNVSHVAGITEGPLILLVPTADAAHEGSSAWIAPCSNIKISQCIIHDGYGELIYLGGGGTVPGEAGSGYPGHDLVEVSDCIIYNTNSRGGQGDGIDVKGGFTNLTIADNEIYDIPSGGTRAIVLQGQMVGESAQNIIIERNYIHDCSGVDEGISLSNSWGVSDTVTIRNNIIETVTGQGIEIFTGTATALAVYNNTFYSCSGVGLVVGSGCVVAVKNNAFLLNNADGQQVSFSGTMTVSNNAYSGSWNGGGSDNVGGITTADFNDPANGDFDIPSDSDLVDMGVDLSATGFSDDYDGSTRVGTWDIGAYEYAGGGGGGTTTGLIMWFRSS